MLDTNTAAAVEERLQFCVVGDHGFPFSFVVIFCFERKQAIPDLLWLLCGENRRKSLERYFCHHGFRFVVLTNSDETMAVDWVALARTIDCRRSTR